MKVASFIYQIFKKFPLLLITNTVLVVMVSLFGTFSLLTISPVIDILVHPDLQGISPLTSKAINILSFFGLPVTLGSLLTIFVLFVSMSSAFQVFARYSILRTVYAVLGDVMLGMFRDFFNARWYFFSSGRQGVLLNSFSRELNVVSYAFNAIAFFFAYIMQLIFFLAVPFYISWQVTLISLVVAFLFSLPFILLGKYSYHWGTLSTSTANDMSSVVQENLTLAKVVLGFGNQYKSVQTLSRAFNAHRLATIRSQLLRASVQILYRPFGIMMIAIALFTARMFSVPLSETTVLLLGLSQVALAISNLTMHKNSLNNFSPSYEQIERLRQQARDLKQTSGSKKFCGFMDELRVSGLTFAYPGHQPVLTDINVRIPRGKMVAFVGESGSGKSTFVDMLMGFHQPVKGEIRVDGTCLRDFDINSYRRRLGYVPQESILFNISIRDNLFWAREDATEDELRHACRQANAEEFIEKLPLKYETLVGDRGVRLSGGQIQRVALARAILRKPEILILDEATSSLDTHSERLIQQAIENIAKETSVIVIAHRLSTVVNADYIYVLKHGRVIEEGPYSDLIRKNGEFQRMASLQALETTNIL